MGLVNKLIFFLLWASKATFDPITDDVIFFLTSPTYHISENIFKNIALTHVSGQLPLLKYTLVLHQSPVFYCSLPKLDEKIPNLIVHVGLWSLNFSDLAMQRNE